MRRYYIFIALLIIASLGLVGAQFISSRGSLSDQVKSQDISNITLAITDYGTAKNKLPAMLKDLKLTAPLRGSLSDYQYTPTTYNQYKICSDFKTANRAGDFIYSDPYHHGKGHVCFDEQVYSIPAISKIMLNN